MPNQYWKKASIIEAWQFDPKTTKFEIWNRSHLDKNLWDVTIDVGKQVFMHTGDWYVTEQIGQTKVEYILSSTDFNNIMEPYEEDEHRASYEDSQELFFNL